MSSESPIELEFNELEKGGLQAWKIKFAQIRNSRAGDDDSGEYERSVQVALGALNRGKNRYMDIIGYERTRVHLNKPSMQHDYTPPEEYLALVQSKLDEAELLKNRARQIERQARAAATPPAQSSQSLSNGRDEEPIKTESTQPLLLSPTVCSDGTTAPLDGVDSSTEHRSEEEPSESADDLRERAKQIQTLGEKYLIKAQHSSDYINANLVLMPEAERAYILTQAPLERTAAEFWEMVFEQRSPAILMLTNLFEKGLSKCFEYYPTKAMFAREKTRRVDSQNCIIYDPPASSQSDSTMNSILDQSIPPSKLGQMCFTDISLRVELLDEQDFGTFVERRYRLTHPIARPDSNADSDDMQPAEEVFSTHELYHFHYRTWPDFGVPETSSDFLNFLLVLRRKGIFSAPVPTAPPPPPPTPNEAESPLPASPLRSPIVHCSAGVGRSGTLCLVDSALCLVEKQRNLEAVRMPDMLFELRRHRPGLVQAPEQLRFCYRAIIDGGHRILRELDRAKRDRPQLPPSEVIESIDFSQPDIDTPEPPPPPPRKPRLDPAVEREQVVKPGPVPVPPSRSVAPFPEAEPSTADASVSEQEERQILLRNRLERKTQMEQKLQEMRTKITADERLQGSLLGRVRRQLTHLAERWVPAQLQPLPGSHLLRGPPSSQVLLGALTFVTIALAIFLYRYV